MRPEQEHQAPLPLTDVLAPLVNAPLNESEEEHEGGEVRISPGAQREAEDRDRAAVRAWDVQGR
jgi:hypothetical protein